MVYFKVIANIVQGKQREACTSWNVHPSNNWCTSMYKTKYKSRYSVHWKNRHTHYDKCYDTCFCTSMYVLLYIHYTTDILLYTKLMYTIYIQFTKTDNKYNKWYTFKLCLIYFCVKVKYIKKKMQFNKTQQLKKTFKVLSKNCACSHTIYNNLIRTCHKIQTPRC